MSNQTKSPWKAPRPCSEAWDIHVVPAPSITEPVRSSCSCVVTLGLFSFVTLSVSRYDRLDLVSCRGERRGCVSILVMLCNMRSAAAPLGRLHTSFTSTCNTGSEFRGGGRPSFERPSPTSHLRPHVFSLLFGFDCDAHRLRPAPKRRLLNLRDFPPMCARN